LQVLIWNFGLVRGFQEHCDKIQIHTDARSNKVVAFPVIADLAFLVFLAPC
jgi:hypothetical protein